MGCDGPGHAGPIPCSATVTKSGAVASKAETSKMTKYAALSTTHRFIPLAFETLGSWGEQAKSFTAELGKRITAITGDVLQSRLMHNTSHKRFHSQRDLT